MRIPTVLAAGVWLATQGVHAQGIQDAAALQLHSLAATCAACHGTQGRAVAGSSVQSLAGQTRESLATRLREFKSGARPATVMHQLSKGYSESQIDALASYFAQQKKEQP